MIKAIQTRYKGYHFRSRLEARWAVFFEKMGLNWEYEPEGFELPGLYYLPDFRVTTPQGFVMWYEVKPRGVSHDDTVSAFARALNQEDDKWNTDIELLSGDPQDVLFTMDVSKYRRNEGYGHLQPMCPRCGIITRPAFDMSDHDGNIEFGCFSCDMTTPMCGDNPAEISQWGVVYTPHKGSLIISLYGYFAFRRKVLKAAVAARSARFEHGETP